MVAEQPASENNPIHRCSLAKISMVAEPLIYELDSTKGCSLAKISMVAERKESYD